MDPSPIPKRKDDHIAIARDGDVAFHETSTLLDQVGFVHEALPEAHVDDIDLSTTILGKKLRAPVVLAGMTGGSAQARDINKRLAAIAQSFGYAFGLGSQRAMVVDPSLTDTYQVRDEAPDVLLLGNIGLNQARELSTARIDEMVQSVGADALCVHMNPAMELVQPEGDRDFRGGLDTFARLAAELSVPVIAKETGCGISASTAHRLLAARVRHVDVSGAGGTSWVAIETERAGDAKRLLGKALREWGIPTAASVMMACAAGMSTVIATGGIRSGMDIARALALGATAGGVARPVLQELLGGGEAAARAWLVGLEQELRAVILLTGATSAHELKSLTLRIGPELRMWSELLPARAQEPR